jgi:hypothetical protein
MENDWIETRIDAALKAYPVPNAVAAAIKEQLRATMSERALRPSELTDLAKTLVSLANTAPPAKEEAR